MRSPRMRSRAGCRRHRCCWWPAPMTQTGHDRVATTGPRHGMGLRSLIARVQSPRGRFVSGAADESGRRGRTTSGVRRSERRRAWALVTSKRVTNRLTRWANPPCFSLSRNRNSPAKLGLSTPVEASHHRRAQNPKVVVEGRSRTLTEEPRGDEHVRPPCSPASTVAVRTARLCSLAMARAVARGTCPGSSQRGNSAAAD